VFASAADVDGQCAAAAAALGANMELLTPAQQVRGLSINNKFK